MLRLSAEDQGFADQLAVTEADLREDGFGKGAPRFFVLIAEVEHRVAGMALYFFTYSTWGSRDGLYLEDLYVRLEYRRFGVARKLMVELARIAVERGCGRFQWVVHSENLAAVRFYDALEARSLDDWRLRSLSGPALVRLANQG